METTHTDESLKEGRPFFSVIVPIYNVKDFLQRAINSLLGQTFTGGLEAILVDDGSTDGSNEICDDYASRFPKRVRVVHKANAGCPAARNTGLDAAQGKYIAFLDADDWFEPDAFQTFYDTLCANKVDVLLFSAWTVFEDGRKFITNEAIKESSKGKVLGQEEFLEKDFFGPLVWNTIYPADFIQTHHLRFNEAIWGPDDEDFAIRAGFYAKTVFLLEYSGYNFFQRDGSITHDFSTSKVLKKIESFCQVLENLQKLSAQGDTIFEKRLLDYIKECAYRIFVSLLSQPIPIADAKIVFQRLKRAGWIPLQLWQRNIPGRLRFPYRLYRCLTRLRIPFRLLKWVNWCIVKNGQLRGKWQKSKNKNNES